MKDHEKELYLQEMEEEFNSDMMEDMKKRQNDYFCYKTGNLFMSAIYGYIIGTSLGYIVVGFIWAWLIIKFIKFVVMVINA